MSRETFTLPDLGEGLTEAHLVRWLVNPGDPITVDAPVAEVETAKAMVEVPSPYGGVVVELHAAEDATILVGEPLISIESARPAAAPAAAEEERGGSGNVLVGYGTATRAAARRRRRAKKHAAPPTAGERPRVVSPLVRALAKEKGIDLAALSGTGPGGLITRSDVEQAAPDQTPDQTRDQAPDQVTAPRSAPQNRPQSGPPVRERVPLRGIRAAIAAGMSRSRREIPEATTWVDVDATALVALRGELGSGPERGPGLLALIARFTVAGLDRFPELNARIDTDAGEIQVFDGVNLGVAAQTDRGLLVPVVRDAHRLSARRLDAEIRKVVAAARDGSAGPADLSGGSFTLNNYGSFGVDGGAAIINHPEVAILGVGRVIQRPWIVDGEVVPRHITQLSLAFDHRVCDGGTAAGFLRFVADAIESPQSILGDL